MHFSSFHPTPGEGQVEKKLAISGIWKFQNVTYTELADMANMWAEGAHKDHYTRLVIRACGKEDHMLGIEFEYVLGGGQTKNGYFHTVSDLLKRKFGSRLIGWDFASPILVIK